MIVSGVLMENLTILRMENDKMNLKEKIIIACKDTFFLFLVLWLPILIFTFILTMFIDDANKWNIFIGSAVITTLSFLCVAFLSFYWDPKNFWQKPLHYKNGEIK